MNLFDGVQLHTGQQGELHCWLDTGHARGWLTPATGAPARGASAGGTEKMFVRHFAQAMAEGFVAADAAVIAMLKTFDPDTLPLLSWGDEPAVASTAPVQPRRLDLYAIVDSAERVLQVLGAGIKTVQLRIKTTEHPDAQFLDMLRGEIRRSVAACEAAGAELFINDHWQLAAEAGAAAVHLGQEDLLALGDSGRAALRATGMALGISSHSLWELCRARVLAPRYIACGPVWPTLTKAMPWRAQGADNLGWWCRMAGTPVVAIGGVLGPEQVFEAASCGVDGVCIVRGLGQHPETIVPQLHAALDAGRRSAPNPDSQAAWPHPSLARV